MIFDPGQNNQTEGNQIVVPPNGTLILGTDLINGTSSKSGRFTNPFSVAPIRSTDHGATGPVPPWSA